MDNKTKIKIRAVMLAIFIVFAFFGIVLLGAYLALDVYPENGEFIMNVILAILVIFLSVLVVPMNQCFHSIR